MNKLSVRLEAVANYVDDNSKVIDIGCDHGFLSIFLAKKYDNIKIIASDIKRKKNSEIANLVLGYEDVESVNDYLSYSLSKFNKIWDNEKEIIENMTIEKIKEIISKVSFDEISTLIVEPKKTEDK